MAPMGRDCVLTALAILFSVGAARAGYIEDRAAATKLTDASEQERALAAFQAMAAGKVTELQKSDALEQVAMCAYALKQYDRAMEVAQSIPIEAHAKVAQMVIMMNGNQWQEVVARFGGEDLDAWPDTLKARASYARGRAFHAAQNGAAAAKDLERAAKYLLSEGRIRGKALTLLAATYAGMLQDDAQALATYQRLYDMGDVLRQGTAAIGMAGILQRQGRYDDALAALERVDLAQIGDASLRGRVLETAGDVLAAAGRKDDAGAKYRTALQAENVPDAIRQSCEKKLEGLAGIP